MTSRASSCSKVSAGPSGTPSGDLQASAGALISGGADISDIAAAISAAELSMIAAANDPAVRMALFLLTQIPLAARGQRFVPELRT